MKKLIVPLICAILIILTSVSASKISSFIESKINSSQKLIINEANNFVKNEGFMYVQLTDDFVPYSYQDLINITYTAINRGWDSFTFYCPSEYQDCIKDMGEISNDKLILTHINNYVHPYNSFTNIATQIFESGEISFKISHVYTDEQIKAIDKEIDRIIAEVTSNDKTPYDNLKALHDYIINNTKYDENVGKTGLKSNIAYGLLFEHYATCNGYTDTMAIMLSKLGYKNYKIATTPELISYESTGHVWNAVYYDNKWLHIDLTWDDPVSESGKDYLYHKYFLVNNEALKEADSGEVKVEEHNFDDSIYLEFNDSIKDIISS